MCPLQHWAAALLLLCGWADAEPIVLRTAAQVGAEPKFVAAKQDDGTPSTRGYCVDVFRAIEALDPGLRFTGETRWIPTKRLEMMLTSGELDVLCGVRRTDERAQILDFLDTPVAMVSYKLVSRRADSATIGSYNDLLGLAPDNVVLVNSGFPIAASLRKIGVPVDDGAADTTQNLNKLIVGRARFFSYREPGISYEIARLGLQGKVKIQPFVQERSPQQMVISRKLPPAVRARLVTALATLQQRGQLEEIQSHW